jgi:hypothetical protein
MLYVPQRSFFGLKFFCYSSKQMLSQARALPSISFQLDGTISIFLVWCDVIHQATSDTGRTAASVVMSE